VSIRRAEAAHSRSRATSGPLRSSAGKNAWSEGGAQPAPNPAAVTERLRQIWLTPHGVVKAALASGAPVDTNVFTFKAEDRDVKVTLNQDNLVEKVEYLTTNSVVGDVPVELTYSDYAQFGTIQFPKHIVEKQDGFPTLDITINDVQPNAAVSLPVPGNVASAPAPPATPMATIDKGRGRSLVFEQRGHAQPRRRVRRSHRYARRADERRALEGRQRSRPPDGTEQADPIRREYPCSLRSCWRPA
jgi:hypothetical protein